MSKTRQGSRAGVTTAESGATKLPTVGMGKREKQVHQIQGGAAAATASLSSSQKTAKKTDEGTKEIALIESVQKDTEGLAFYVCRGYDNQSAFLGRCSQLGCALWGPCTRVS